MALDPIMDFLRASLEEQVPVRVLTRGGSLGGIVTRIGETAVEIDSTGKRSAVRLTSIDAVTLGAHGEATPLNLWAKE